MNPSAPSQAELHQAIQELLPWFVANTLSEPEKDMVEQHLASCPQCQSELEWQQTLRDNEPHATAMPNVDAAFARLLPRLAEQPAHIEPPEQAKATDVHSILARLRAWMQNRLQQPGWVMTAMAGQGVLIVGLALGLAFQVSEQDGQIKQYRALSAKSGSINSGDAGSANTSPGSTSERQADGDIAVTFKPSATIQEIQKSLHASGARIVDGPTIADVYVLSVPADHHQQAMETLRAQAHIASVASLKAGGTE